MDVALAAFAVAASALLWTATALAWAARQGAFAAAWCDWAKLPRLRKALSLVSLAALVSWAGTKPAGVSHGATEARSESGVLDRINRIDRIETETSDLRASVAPCEKTILSADATSFSNPVNPVNPVEENDLVLVSVGTNEVFDFSAPDGATVAEKWRRRGASKDYLRLSFANWSFPFGGESFSNLVVFAGGRIRLSRDAEICPFAANISLVPEARWESVETTAKRPAALNTEETEEERHGEEGVGVLDRINRIDRIEAGAANLRASVAPCEKTVLTANPVNPVEKKAVTEFSASPRLSNLRVEAPQATNECLSNHSPPLASTSTFSSLFWHLLTPSNTLVLTWQNALLERETANPVSFQAELFRNGNAVFRYDLSRLGNDALLTNVVVSMKGREGQEGREGLETEKITLTRALSSLAFKTENELLCDEARAAFDDALCVLDPLVRPVGSTNTVWEHYVYTGTTNGAFALPSSTASAAVLRVTVAGSGRGELLVGNRAVPLVGEGSTNTISHGATEARSGSLSLRASEAPCEASTQRQVLLPINRGQTVPLYLRADATLSVAFASDDFAFGVLPDLAASRPSGRINFPNATATTPCFHDYVARQTSVSLPAGANADALTCEWTGTASVVASNVPPRSAVLTGNFDGRTTTTITYALSHPEYLFGRTTHSQTARFCPPPPDADDEETLRRYGDGGGENAGKVCWHCAWGKCGQDCDCCASCRHGDDSSDDVPDEPDAEDYAVAVTNWPHLGGVLKIREPLRYDRSVFLAVPGGAAPRCCPCPGHATNHVALVCRSSQLKVVDVGGRDFRSSTESTTVRIAGASPSMAVGDAYVAFATNGAVCLDGEFTVLGVGVRKPGVDLALLNARSASFGLPVPATTNFLDAASMELVTEVGLPGGNVHVGFEGASAPFALWVWDYTLKDYRRLVSSSDGGALDVSLATWRKLVGGATDAATSRTAVRVTAEWPGAADLVFRYWNVIDGKFVEDEARQRLTAVASPLRADVNRDGRIDADDAALSRMGRPFRFWTNEDTEKGDYVGQVADATPNASDLKVNGKLDLVNLFPVVVDVSQFRRAWGAAATARLRASSSARLRYCVLGDGFSSENALGLATSAVATADGTPLEEAALTPLGYDGIDVGTLAGGSLSSPVALAFEAAKSVDAWSGPEVVVSFGGAEVYRERLPVSITSIDAMYRHADLRGAAENAAFAPTAPGEPWNGPDGETDGRHFVFVHGYNVDAAASRAWARAIFKRLWWAGSRAAFTAVDWKGDDSQMSVPAKGDISPNYYANVKNAFMTADALTRLCGMLSGEKVMLAHSLGNVLVSSAAVDHGLAYSRCYMLNAAVPMEAYYAEEQDELMVDGAWKDIGERFRASSFAALFASATNDFRCGLSWKGRFNGLRNAVNCYSPTEDVLANPSRMKVFGVQSEDFGGAWAKQELFKGCALWYGVNAATFAGAAIEGGWGVNARFVANPLAYVPLVGFNASYFANYTRNDLIASPLYTSFDDERMTSTNLLAFADAELRAKMLGDAIPAESFAAGANETVGVSENYNMQSELPNGWPEDIGKDLPNSEREKVWRHSDIKNVAFWYVYLLFKRLLL